MVVSIFLWLSLKFYYLRIICCYWAVLFLANTLLKQKKKNELIVKAQQQQQSLRNNGFTATMLLQLKCRLCILFLAVIKCLHKITSAAASSSLFIRSQVDTHMLIFGAWFAPQRHLTPAFLIISAQQRYWMYLELSIWTNFFLFWFGFWRLNDLLGFYLSKHNEPTKAASSCNNNLSKRNNCANISEANMCKWNEKIGATATFIAQWRELIRFWHTRKHSLSHTHTQEKHKNFTFLIILRFGELKRHIMPSRFESRSPSSNTKTTIATHSPAWTFVRAFMK